MILKDNNHQTTTGVHINPPRIQWNLKDNFCKNHEEGLSEETEFPDKSTDKEKETTIFIIIQGKKILKEISYLSSLQY